MDQAGDGCVSKAFALKPGDLSSDLWNPRKAACSGSDVCDLSVPVGNERWRQESLQKHEVPEAWLTQSGVKTLP